VVAAASLAALVVAALAYAALAYVVRPSPSATSRIAPPRKSEEHVAGILSSRKAASSVAASAPATLLPIPTAPPASSAPITDRILAGSRVQVLPAAATTESQPITRKATGSSAAVPSFVGSLHVMSQPEGAEVSLNGVPQGHTPLTIRNLSPGSRVVSLSLPGYERWSWSVAVVANRQTPLAVKLQAERRSGQPE
jgi:hypothetical protein